MAVNRIEIVNFGINRHKEAPANAALKPGHIISLMSTGKVKKHDVVGGVSQFLIAKEDALQGNLITDAFAQDDIVPYAIGVRGDKFYPRIPANAPAILVGDLLESNGDGCLRKALLNSGVLFAAAAASTALNTHTTITPFDVSTSIPANALKVGDIIHIQAVVLFANASNSTETSVITLKFGGLTIKATTALDHAAADIAVIDAYIHVRAIGASGSVVAYGTHQAGAPATASVFAFYTAAQTLDTTAAATITVSQTNSASHANTGGQLVDLVVDASHTAGVGPIAVAEEAVDNSAVAAEAFILASVL